MRFAKDVTINARADKVYEYVADFSRHGEWGGHGLKIEAPAGPAAVGFNVQSLARQFGPQRENRTVTEAATGQRFAFESAGGLGTVLNAFDIESEGEETRLTKSQDFVKPSFLCRLMTPMISSQRSKELATDVEQIKNRLES